MDTGMISSRLNLNVRQTQGMISVKTTLGKLESHFGQPKMDGHYEAPRSGVYATQPSIEIDTYPSRHSYGFTNHSDFAKEAQQKGFEGASEGRSRRTQEAWNYIENAAKPGRNVPQEMAQSKLRDNFRVKRHMVAQAIPDPKITGHPSELQGSNDRGDISLKITPPAKAPTNFTPGHVDIELTQAADTHRWISMGHLDLRA